MIDQLKRYELAQALKRKRKLAEKEIRVIKNTVVKPSSSDLASMRQALDNIHDMNFKAHNSAGIKRNNLLHRIQREKQKINNLLFKYTSFKYEIPPKSGGDYVFVTEIFEYNKIDKAIASIIDELDNVSLPDVEIVAENKKIFGNSGI